MTEGINATNNIKLNNIMEFSHFGKLCFWNSLHSTNMCNLLIRTSTTIENINALCNNIYLLLIAFLCFKMDNNCVLNKITNNIHTEMKLSRGSTPTHKYFYGFSPKLAFKTKLYEFLPNFIYSYCKDGISDWTNPVVWLT